jgi:hypothetical protein
MNIIFYSLGVSGIVRWLILKINNWTKDPMRNAVQTVQGKKKLFPEDLLM